MVKKRLRSGEACDKCAQAEALLRRRGLWGAIDRVVWALEGEPESPGMQLAYQHGIELAPFFIVEQGDEPPAIYVSALKLIKERLKAPVGPSPPREVHAAGALDLDEASRTLDGAHPRDIVRWALERYGAGATIAFSGAEDVALVDMAAATGLPYRVITLDTGRLHPETYVFLERVREHYGVAIEVFSPETAAVEQLVRSKGLFSFYRDGHGECCGIRKVAPLGRALVDVPAWMTGQRHDQSPATRAGIATIQLDPRGAHQTPPRVKLNPMADWTAADVWAYLRAADAPTNSLHERGFRSIGCAPCTRAVNPGQHEREGRWWWEDATKRECGLHLSSP